MRNVSQERRLGFIGLSFFFFSSLPQIPRREGFSFLFHPDNAIHTL